MRDSNRSLVDISDLVVTFGDPGAPKFNAVDGVTLSIKPGEVLGLVGESGSGKTTLAKAILRLYEPADGTIQFDGTDITHLSDGELRSLRRQMQMVFQDPLSSFNPRVRIRDAIALPMRLRGAAPVKDIPKAVEHLLSRVGLGPQFLGRYPHEMSGGQLQRVAIARALAVEPRLIVADEAVSKLDVSVRAQILNLLRDVQASTGVALLFITHDLRVARYLCDRIGVMFFGRLVEIGATEDIFETPRHPYTRALLATLDDDAGELTALEAPAPAGDGCRYRTRCALVQADCSVHRPLLQLAANGRQAVACPYSVSG